jgi:uncharacterized membrane protein required for colicin V production
MASLGSIVLSYLVALSFSEPLAPVFHTQAPWNRFLAMAVLYVLTSFLVWFAFRIVAGAIDRVKLREFDRQIGALFGAFKGVLLCVAITFFAVTLSTSARGSVLKSRSGVYIAQLLNKADAVMPKELHKVLDPYMDRLERGLDPNEPDPATAEEGDRWRDTFSRQVERGVERAGEAVEKTVKRRFGKSDDGEEDQGWGRREGRASIEDQGWSDDRPRYRDDQDERDAEADRPARRY